MTLSQFQKNHYGFSVRRDDGWPQGIGSNVGDLHPMGVPARDSARFDGVLLAVRLGDRFWHQISGASQAHLPCLRL